ncbi:hypothetical protein CRE_04176 [Caenorhabditis remanei]|uniref:VWFA domain-containing protein n=1 Tax=Caenorhabditis remanei TaxID=31234 RepID=E3MYU1_CAERE|nr:hypothetical protein CRE_04176 [Caenorhabditis remanei]
MKLGLLILLHLISVYADYSPLSYVDRPCGEDLTNLWLDVIAVVDNSRGMTVDGLNEIASNIASVFGFGTRIGLNASEPRTTRLGLVTYNSVATQKADLNQYQSIGDVFHGIFYALSNTVDTTESYLATGLELAEKMFNDQSVNSIRAHYQKVVIVYAATYQTKGEMDPESIADRLKMSGVKIITVAYGDAYGLMKSLSVIASPRFALSNLADSPGNLIVQIQISLLEANWLSAKMSCSNRRSNSSLATEFSQAKHDFIFNVVQNTTGFSPPYQYHVGLNYVSGLWVWTQPTGRQQVPLQKPFMWLSGNPQRSSTQSAVMNMQSGHGTGWQNIATMTLSANFICETYSCDTDNYCGA